MPSEQEVLDKLKLRDVDVLKQVSESEAYGHYQSIGYISVMAKVRLSLVRRSLAILRQHGLVHIISVYDEDTYKFCGSRWIRTPFGDNVSKLAIQIEKEHA